MDTTEGKVYCCAIKDLFSNRIVGHAVSDRTTADLAVAGCGLLWRGVNPTAS